MIINLTWATVACLLAFITQRKAWLFFILGFILNWAVFIPLGFTWARAFRGHWKCEMLIQEELKALESL